MSDDYIRREDAKEKIRNSLNYLYAYGVDRAPELIDELEPADVVPVVRCRNCKHLRITPTGMLWCKHEKGLPKLEYKDFCSYGERKE